MLGKARTRARRRGDRLVVRVRGVADVARLAVASVGEAPVQGLDLDVDTWRAPAGWVGSPGIGGLTGVEAERAGDGAQVRLTTAAPADPGVLLAAALRMLRPVPTGSIHPRMTFTAGLPEQAASIAHFLRDVLDPRRTAGQEMNPHLRRTDLLVTADPAALAGGSDRACTVVVEGSRWSVVDAGQPADVTDVYVDPAVHRPFGRRSDAPAIVGSAGIDGGVLTVTGEGASVRVDGDLGPSDVAALRALRGVVVTGDLGDRWTTQLRAGGLVLASAAGDLPAADDHLGWLVRSVDGTRDAFRASTPAAAWNGWPSVSVVLVTHRDTFVDHAVRQLARLDYPRMQVVVGRHGAAFDPARLAPLRETLKAAGHDLLVVDIDRGWSFGDAMQQASARASGTLIAKVDDDDHYAPTHIWDLVIARMHSGAQLVGKALDWVHLEGEDTTVFRPAYAAERYATFVAGGTMLISAADLGAVGGWAPVPKSVDRALIDRVKERGGLVYRTHGLGYVYVRHAGDHTADVREQHFLTKTVATYPGLHAHPALGTVAS